MKPYRRNVREEIIVKSYFRKARVQKCSEWLSTPPLWSLLEALEPHPRLHNLNPTSAITWAIELVFPKGSPRINERIQRWPPTFTSSLFNWKSWNRNYACRGHCVKLKKWVITFGTWPTPYATYGHVMLQCQQKANKPVVHTMNDGDWCTCTKPYVWSVLQRGECLLSGFITAMALTGYSQWADCVLQLAYSVENTLMVLCRNVTLLQG